MPGSDSGFLNWIMKEWKRYVGTILLMETLFPTGNQMIDPRILYANEPCDSIRTCYLQN